MIQNLIKPTNLNMPQISNLQLSQMTRFAHLLKNIPFVSSKTGGIRTIQGSTFRIKNPST